MAYHRYSRYAPGFNSVSYAPAPVDPQETVRIDAVLNNSAFTALPANKQEFIKSIKDQAGKKGLSTAQLNYLASIEKSLAPVDNGWWDDTNPENAVKRQFALHYYAANGYYSLVVAKMKVNPAFIPDKDTWHKMWGNKFINARYKRFIEGPKHTVGQIAIGKYTYGGPNNGIIQKIEFNYYDGRWQYEILLFDAGRVATFKDSEVKAAEKPARKARSKKVK
jgi:hypothetical protein